MPRPFAHMFRLPALRERDEPEPRFALTCGCGEPVEGVRGPEPQDVPCPRCGERIFVLPVQPPLPDVVRKAARRRARQHSRFKRPPMERLWPLSWVETLIIAALLALMLAGYLWKAAHENDEPPPDPPAGNAVRTD